MWTPKENIINPKTGRTIIKTIVFLITIITLAVINNKKYKSKFI